MEIGDSMKKVTIFALHLGYGGIEKSITSLANALTERYEVEIISTYKILEQPAFNLNKKIKVKYLIEEVMPNREEWKKTIKEKRIFAFLKESAKSIYCLFLRRTRTINAMSKTDADFIVSTRDLFNTWAGKYINQRTKKVAWEHNHHHGNEKYIKKVVTSCKNIDELVLVSDSLRNFYKKELKEKGYKCHANYIPNVVEAIPEKTSKLDNKNIISVGRFSREKGFPDLIDIFKLVKEEEKGIHLDLVGDGAQKNMIVDKVYEYGLENDTTVHGFLKKEEINKLLQNSSLYVMTSFTESFGIVLIEAMSFGIPCIAFSSAEGACDLIENGKNGYLIDNRDKDKMKEKIIEVLENDKLRQELGNNAREFSKNYTIDIVKEQWFKLLK